MPTGNENTKTTANCSSKITSPPAEKRNVPLATVEVTITMSFGGRAIALLKRVNIFLIIGDRRLRSWRLKKCQLKKY
ncbi:hypothetical protein IQ238_21170 [Pleurocapsales cyanobacterium LEGE 06147]|nr:hypothetical protein [Pleurocapsales cyanobacterium LEGE 06147]